MKYDLLSTVEYGGCSAKLSPDQLAGILDKLPKVKHENILVDIETHDDAGVYKINDETALIFTTDFFPPICSDAYEFGQIAAANALSDVYAMGGTPIMALNLMMFSSADIPMEVFSDILNGGHDKVSESGAVILGGHTIEDNPPKYGLAVVGTVHPNKLITNSGAKEGDKLILTKPLGIGAVLAGQKMGMSTDNMVESAKREMSLLNKVGAEIMVKHGVKGATDITGFALLGHAMRLAQASKVSLKIHSQKLPLIDGVYELMDEGCIPGAAFRNLKFVQDDVFFKSGCDYNLKMLACDAQTSGGLLMSVPSDKVDVVMKELSDSELHNQARVIGEVIPKSGKSIYFE